MTMPGYDLAAATHDSQGPPAEVEPPSDERVREWAESAYYAGWTERDVEIPKDAPVERVKDGYWVTVRLWVPGDEVD